MRIRWIDGAALQEGDIVCDYRGMGPTPRVPELPIGHSPDDYLAGLDLTRAQVVRIVPASKPGGRRTITVRRLHDGQHGMMLSGFSSYEIPLGAAEGYWWLLLEDGSAGTLVPTPAGTSQWNGTCPTCGRGTYTGFSSMEHEGGGCP